MGEYLARWGRTWSSAAADRKLIEQAAGPKWRQPPAARCWRWPATYGSPSRSRPCTRPRLSEFGTLARADQQRRRQFYLPHGAAQLQRLQLGGRYRAQGDVQLHAGPGQALDRRRDAGRRAQYQHDLCLDGFGLCRSLGRFQGRGVDHGSLAGLGMGQVWHSARMRSPRAHFRPKEPGLDCGRRHSARMPIR